MFEKVFHTETEIDGFIIYGLLALLVGGRLKASVIGPFDDMNWALKERAEA